ncbi:hypothetical protein Aru02nite_14540 [Actinocatenispora rupis]|uniref:Uncharacterized protein n=1 Tax=Actinocatenispora rupis TaxID=519421 RepID=A0A8J3NBA0_9ACTN|nr:hypothetical protein Aru02nite_14540 [Actinocatenispora rupis]
MARLEAFGRSVVQRIQRTPGRARAGSTGKPELVPVEQPREVHPGRAPVGPARFATAGGATAESVAAIGDWHGAVAATPPQIVQLSHCSTMRQLNNETVGQCD